MRSENHSCGCDDKVNKKCITVDVADARMKLSTTGSRIERS